MVHSALTVSDDGEPAVVGDLQPLVSIGGPGVRVLQSPGQPGHLRDNARPETESAIDVQPGVKSLFAAFDALLSAAGARGSLECPPSRRL